MKNTAKMKNFKIQILRIMKDGKVHQKDDLVIKIAIRNKMTRTEMTKIGKNGRFTLEQDIRNALSQLNKAELIVHKKDKDGKKILTFFVIKKAGLETLKLI